MSNIEIYTDGSSLGNPGPGGWGVVVIEKSKIIKEASGGNNDTTNNRMELTAAIKALEYIRSKEDLAQVEIHTDSSYVLGGITIWIKNWEKNGWKTANKKPVLNKDLWQDLSELAKETEKIVSWHKVKGHSGHIYNDKADELATEAASNYK